MNDLQCILKAVDAQAWDRLGIVLSPTEPWEGHHIQNFTCVADPLGYGRWRLWYSASDPELPYAIAIAEGVPGESLQKNRAVLRAGRPDSTAFLSIGNLPEGWNPVQPVEIRLPDGRHRLYFWAHGPGVVRYLAAESDDGYHFEVLDPYRPCLYHPNDRAAFSAPNAKLAGLTLTQRGRHQRPASELVAPRHLVCNDATNVYQLDDGTYECYTVGLIEVAAGNNRYIAHDNAAGWVRVIDRLSSHDGLDWGSRERVIVPDEEDPDDLQFYYLSVHHRDNGDRLGLLGHYRVEAQTLDFEWCASQDGLAWNRTRRGIWLADSDIKSPDSYGVYAPSTPVVDGGDAWLFYTGVNHTHNRKYSEGVARTVVMLAKCDSPNVFGV